MPNGEHYYQPSLTAVGNRCLLCGESNGRGPHIRLTWSQWAGAEPAPQDPNPMVIVPSRQNGKPFDPYGIFPESEKPNYVFDPVTLPQDRLGDPIEDIRAQLTAEADEIPKRIKRRLLEQEDPFPPERHRGNRATVAYYDEADLVVRGNPRHARTRVGIFKKIRNEYRDLKKYRELTVGDKVILLVALGFTGLNMAFGIINVLN
jgi:hypothetical protein